MAGRTTIDVSEIVENQKLSFFLVGLVAVSWIITFFDGFDMNVIAFAAPYFSQQYHIDRVSLGYIFSMGLVGTLIGGFLLGYLGDIIGRRPAVILATASFGILTLCFTFASGYWSLFWLRLLDGIPIGGMLPLAWALNIEYAPKRYRATIVTLIMIGYSVGTSLGGPIAIGLIPHYGWQSVFVFGGILSLISAAVLFLMLPESIRFLASKGGRAERIAPIIRRIAPRTPVPADAQFVLADEGGQARDFRPSLLFGGELRAITPLLWLAYIASSLAVFFFATWTPLVFEAVGFTRTDAALAATVNAVMGAVGGLLLMRFTDNRGAIAITIMPLVAIPLLLIDGLAPIGHAGFFVVNGLMALFLVGGHFGLHSIAGIFYPSAYRANGAGWATSVAKIGSIAGPVAGGIVLTVLPVRNVFAVLAVCPAVFAVCIFVVGRIHSRILGREALAAPDPSAALLAGGGPAD